MRVELLDGSYRTVVTGLQTTATDIAKVTLADHFSIFNARMRSSRPFASCSTLTCLLRSQYVAKKNKLVLPYHKDRFCFGLCQIAMERGTNHTSRAHATLNSNSPYLCSAGVYVSECFLSDGARLLDVIIGWLQAQERDQAKKERTKGTALCAFPSSPPSNF